MLQLDTQANAIQALESGRADAAVVDLSTVGWLVKRNPDRYLDSGFHYNTQLYSCAMRQGDLDWLTWVNTRLNVAMHGHQTEIYDKAFMEFFGATPPRRVPGFPASSEREQLPRRRPCSAGDAVTRVNTTSTSTSSGSTRTSSRWGLVLSLELACISILIGCVIGLALAVVYNDGHPWLSGAVVGLCRVRPQRAAAAADLSRLLRHSHPSAASLSTPPRASC